MADCSFQQLLPSPLALEALQASLYGDNAPGYSVLRNYLSPEEVRHLQTCWAHYPPDPALFDTVPTNVKRLGQRPFAYYGQRRTTYQNYLWNKPVDELSHAICFAVTLLRNQLQQTPLYFNLAANGLRMASYRVVLSGTYKPDDIEVLPHQDFAEAHYGTDEPASQSYLQATLFLSEHAVDYQGNGFFFTTNQGKKLYPGPELAMKPGDLMIWRYINLHGVDGTQALPGGLGFMRMVFPHEEIQMPEIRITKPSVLHRLATKFKKTLNRAAL